MQENAYLRRNFVVIRMGVKIMDFKLAGENVVRPKPTTPYIKEVQTEKGLLIVKAPVSAEEVNSLNIDPGLKAFRAPESQKEALAEIAGLSEGRLSIAINEGTIVGYVTFHFPDEFERWGQAKMDNLLELGAIEVTREWRKSHVSRHLLEVSFMDNTLEDFIIISTEYYWHWDLKGTGLDVWQYKDVMQKVLGAVGMQNAATDEPEIASHAANSLMVRIGENVPIESVIKFETMRFKNRWMF